MKKIRSSYTRLIVSVSANEEFTPDTDDLFLDIVPFGANCLPCNISQGNLQARAGGGNYQTSGTEIYNTADSGPYNVATWTAINMASDSAIQLGHYGPTFRATEDSHITFVIQK